MKDELGKSRNKVVWTVERTDGSIEQMISPNLRVNTGIAWQAGHMHDTVTAKMDKLAVTENTGAPASGDTNLVGELAADGMQRAAATVTLPAGTDSVVTLSNSWQYTGASVITVAKASVCSDATDTDTSNDSIFLMTLVSPVAVLDSNDTLTIDWGITL